MGFIELYKGILRYETAVYPTMPNFIYLYLLYMVYFHFSIQQTPFLSAGNMSSSRLFTLNYFNIFRCKGSFSAAYVFI